MVMNLQAKSSNFLQPQPLIDLTFAFRRVVDVAATQKLDVTYLRLWAAQLDISADIEKLLEATRR